MYTGNCNSSDDDEDGSLSTGAAVAITAVVTFIITLVVTVVIMSIITKLYYQRQTKKIVMTKSTNTQGNSQFVIMDQDVKMDSNPAYAVMEKHTIKMDTNPAYAIPK